MTRKLVFAMLTTLLIAAALTSVFQAQGVYRLLGSSSEFQAGSLSDFEQQVVAFVNGSRAYGYDLELENIASKYLDFRSAGSPGASETANWIKEQFLNLGLESWLEPFEFTNWTLLDESSLIIDEDGNQSTVSDQIEIGSFQCEHYSWPTSDEGIFADLIVLPLPPAADYTELGENLIDEAAWDAISTTGKIVLIGREVRWNNNWVQTYVSKLTEQPPAAVVYTWWYSWMSFTPPFFASAGGVPLNGRYYWNSEIPVGFMNYEDGLWVRNSENANANAAAYVTIRSVIDYGTHYNVVGRINGFLNPEKIVIISGHYDTVMCNGFCDNGAGVAGIIELAEVFAEAVEKEIYKPSYTLLFVAFTGEELYLVGSANYVKQHKNDMANIAAVINLDCIGSDNLYVSQTPGSNLQQTIVQAAQDLGIIIAVESPGGSDQESFRIPSYINNMVLMSWGVDLDISDAAPVASSAMLDSYPLWYSSMWDMGEAGWIHTAYDNSTSTETKNWVEAEDLGNHIKVAALTIMNMSPNVVPEFPSLFILLLFVIATLLAIIVFRRKEHRIQ